jgi:hypothetical protein
MLIIALVLAVIGLAALVTAVVTSNALIAWVCIGASVLGVLLLIVDALRERSRDAGDDDAVAEPDDLDNPAEETTVLAQSEPAEDYPEEQDAETPVEPEPDATAVDVEEHDDETSTSKTD